MTFLALAPWQVLALCSMTAGLVIWFFFLKLRHPPVAVASLLLWKRVLVDKEHRSLWERLRRLISLLLALTIALLIAAALGRPQSGALTGEPRNVAVVLDTSASMAAATADGQTRWAHARDAARRMIEAAGATDQFLVADTSGRIATALTSDRGELFAAIDAMVPSVARSAFPSIDTTDREVVFISDGAAAVRLPADTQTMSVFESADNVAVTDFQVTLDPADPARRQAHVQITSYADADQDVELTLGDESTPLVRGTLRLAAGQVLSRSFVLDGALNGSIRAYVEPARDALALDNVAVDYVAPPHSVRVMLVTTGDTYLETLLSLDPRVELRVVQPDVFREDPTVNAYVFDRFAPTNKPTRPALLFRPPGRAWLAGSDRAPALRATGLRVTTWNEDHPVLQFVSEIDLGIREARHLELAEPGTVNVVAAAGETPLIVAEDASPRWVMVTFDLERSDFAVRPGFPIFMQNVLTWFLGAPSTLRRNVGTVDVPMPRARITTLDGTVIPARSQLASTRFEASEPGVYLATAGSARQYVAVTLANRDVSDLRRSTFQGAETVSAPPRRWLHRELWTYMLILAIVLITLEWWTYHRRITV